MYERLSDHGGKSHSTGGTRLPAPNVDPIPLNQDGNESRGMKKLFHGSEVGARGDACDESPSGEWLIIGLAHDGGWSGLGEKVVSMGDLRPGSVSREGWEHTT